MRQLLYAVETKRYGIHHINNIPSDIFHQDFKVSIICVYNKRSQYLFKSYLWLSIQEVGIGVQVLGGTYPPLSQVVEGEFLKW